MSPERTEPETWLKSAEDDFAVIQILKEAKCWSHGCYFACLSVEKFGKYLLLAKGGEEEAVKPLGHELRTIWERVKALYGKSNQLADLRKELYHMSEYSNEGGNVSYRYPARGHTPSERFTRTDLETHLKIATLARDLATTDTSAKE